MESQEANVALKAGEPLDPVALREAVQKADFNLRKIRLTAYGELISHPGHPGLALKISETGQVFLLTSVVTEKKEAPEEGDKLGELRGALEKGQKEAVIRGEVSENGKMPLKLSIETFEVVQENDGNK